MIGNRRDAMPPFAAAGRDPDFDLLLNPARFYTHPQDVLDDPQASLEEKRAV
jgi:hypothetical protein